MKNHVLLPFLLSAAFISYTGAQENIQPDQPQAATQAEQDQKQIINRVASYLISLKKAVVDEYLTQGACPASIKFIDDYSKEILKNNPNLESVDMQGDCSIDTKFKENPELPALSNHTLSLQMVAQPGGATTWSCVFSGDNINVLPEGCERIEED